MTLTIISAAQDILGTVSPWEKAEKSRAYAQSWRSGAFAGVGKPAPLPDKPARPDKPKLRPTSEMPKRGKGGTLKSKIALLHALAHIELNAIDLAWDLMGRFVALAEENISDQGAFSLPNAFYDDWIKVADDEAKHFLMIAGRLEELESHYGALPAHEGLWESSMRTAHDFGARLAIVPMVLEARGLDVTPNMAVAMRKQGDGITAEMLKTIHDDEITHVAAGTVWFDKLCEHQGKDPEDVWQDLVREYFIGHLKRPFNHPSREKAGMIRDWYELLADEGEAEREANREVCSPMSEAK